MPAEIPVEIVKPLEPQRCMEEETVELVCELSQQSPVTWYKDGQPITESDTVKLTNEGPVQKLTIVGASLADKAEYTISAGPAKSTASLVVQGIYCGTVISYFLFSISHCVVWRVVEKPVELTSNLQDVVITQLHAVAEFRLKLSKADCKVNWLIRNAPIHEGPKYTTGLDDLQPYLKVNDITGQDEGEVMVKVDDKVSTARLLVQGDYLPANVCAQVIFGLLISVDML